MTGLERLREICWHRDAIEAERVQLEEQPHSVAKHTLRVILRVLLFLLQQAEVEARDCDDGK